LLRYAVPGCAALAVVASAVAPALAQDSTVDPQLAASRALTREFGERLKTALTEALGRGGPGAAIAVCKDAAPALAVELSRRSGATVARTSARLRNPLNAPPPWAVPVLEQFAAALAAGRPAAGIEYFARTEAGARFMKPIVTEPLCLTCHGTALAPDVQAALARLYPEDHATGFAPGELRGAFVVAWPAAAHP
jgi:hypothetical protein